jgi:hypothetical protein
MKAVHHSDWAQQPDIRIRCDQSYTVPSYKQPEGLPEGVHMADDSRLYTFYREKATCPACMPSVTHVAYRLPDEAGGTVWSAPRPARHIVFGENYGDIVQGFVLDDGSFVDRVEGLAIAKANGQMIRKTQPEDRLFSEDLW